MLVNVLNVRDAVLYLKMNFAQTVADAIHIVLAQFAPIAVQNCTLNLNIFAIIANDVLIVADAATVKAAIRTLTVAPIAQTASAVQGVVASVVSVTKMMTLVLECRFVKASAYRTGKDIPGTNYIG